MPDRPPEMHGEDWQAGYVAATVRSLSEGQMRIEASLRDHREEERGTWKGFEERLANIEERFDAQIKSLSIQVQSLQAWKAWAAGLGAGIALIVSLLWHLFTRR